MHVDGLIPGMSANVHPIALFSSEGGGNDDSEGGGNDDRQFVLLL